MRGAQIVRDGARAHPGPQGQLGAGPRAKRFQARPRSAPPMSSPSALVVIADPIDRGGARPPHAGPVPRRGRERRPGGAGARARGGVGAHRPQPDEGDRRPPRPRPRTSSSSRAPGSASTTSTWRRPPPRGIRVVNAPDRRTPSRRRAHGRALPAARPGPLPPDRLATKAGGWKRGTHGHELSGQHRRVRRLRSHRPGGRRADSRRSASTAIAFDPFVPKPPRRHPAGRARRAARPRGPRQRPRRAHRREPSPPRCAGVRPDEARGVLVNVARGALVDEAALLAALEERSARRGRARRLRGRTPGEPRAAGASRT